jgi:Domain of unknown function (DUF1844)
VSERENEGPTSGEVRTARQAFDEAGGRGQLPPIDFATFVLSLHHSASMHLGGGSEGGKEKAAVDLLLARQTIDLIALLQERTRGNLTGEEERIVEQALYDLRMRYVEVSKGK